MKQFFTGIGTILTILLILSSCSGNSGIKYELVPKEKCTLSFLLDKDGAEILRYYKFSLDNGNEEWVTVSDQGFYDASHSGASLVGIKTKKSIYSLEQFSQIFYRPDLVRALENGEEVKADKNLASVLKDAGTIPQLNVLSEGEILKVTVSESGGLTGPLVIYAKDSGGFETPAAIFDPAGSAKKVYKQKGQIHYELEISMSGLFTSEKDYTISVFNALRTIESEHLFAGSGTGNLADLENSENKNSAVKDLTEKPVLHFFSMNKTGADTFGVILKQQENGRLYSSVEIHETYGGRALTGDPETVQGKTRKDSVLFLYLPDITGIDKNGDFIFEPAMFENLTGFDNLPKFDKWNLLEILLTLNAQKTVLLMNTGSLTTIAIESGLARLLKLTGSLAVPIIFPDIKVLENVLQEFYSNSKDEGYFTSGDLAALMPFNDEAGRDSLQEKLLITGNFPILERQPSAKETRPQGTAAGAYSYAPAGTWSFPGGLSGFGVFADELNPANYQVIDAPVMISMGMEPHYVSLLAGNRLYETGDYDRAIAEYNKAISIKPDYADAYAWRGNAYRKKGQTGPAIDDYTRALRYKANYPEVYNYRGYLYSQGGNYDRAIADFTQAIRLRANYADAIFNRAYAYAKKNDFDKAINDYTQVLRLESDNAAALIERGRAWQAKGSYENSEADFTAAEKLLKK